MNTAHQALLELVHSSQNELADADGRYDPFRDQLNDLEKALTEGRLDVATLEDTQRAFSALPPTVRHPVRGASVTKIQLNSSRTLIVEIQKTITELGKSK